MNDRSATRVAVIVGMHRSGTSLLARLLDGLGVTFGQRVMTESVPDNQGGYWEHSDIVTAHEALLDDVLDRPWHRARGLEPLTEDWWNSAEVLPYRLALTQVLERECSSATHLFGFKDPRTARLLPLWFDIFRETGIEPAFILATRAPDAVAGSLQRRQGMPFALGRLLWLQHTLEMVSHLDGSVRVVVDYDELLAEPGAMLSRLLRALDLPELGSGRMEEIIASVDRGQRHHVSESEGLDEWAARAHALLLEMDQVGRFPPALLEMAESFVAVQPLLAVSARELEAAGETIATKEEIVRRVTRDAAVAEETISRMTYHGFRDISPRDVALLAPVQDELALTRNSLAATNEHLLATRTELGTTRQELLATRTELDTTSQHLVATQTELGSTRQDLVATQTELGTIWRDLLATRTELDTTRQNLVTTQEFFFVQFSRLIPALAPGQRDLLQRPTKSPTQRLETARKLLARLRGYRSWRWPLLLISPKGTATDSRDPENELLAIDQIVSVLVSRSWRYTRPLRWLDYLRHRRIQPESSPEREDLPAQTDDVPQVSDVSEMSAGPRLDHEGLPAQTDGVSQVSDVSEISPEPSRDREDLPAQTDDVSQASDVSEISPEPSPDREDLPAQTDDVSQASDVSEISPEPQHISKPVPRESPYSPLYNAWALRRQALPATPPGPGGRVLLLASLGDAAATAHFPAMFETLCQQTWTDWRLIVCVDDNATLPHFAEYRSDSRIRIMEAVTQVALETALAEEQKWEWLVWLRATDLYEPDAIAAALESGSAKYDVVYSDFDRIDQWGTRFGPTFFGPPVAHVPFMALRLDGFALISRQIAERTGVRVCRSTADLFHQHVDWVQGAEFSRVCHVPHLLVHRKAVPSSLAYPASVFADLRLEDIIGQFGWRVVTGYSGLAEGPGLGVEPLASRGIRVVVCVLNEIRAPLASWMMSALREIEMALEIVVFGMPVDALPDGNESLTGRLHIVEPVTGNFIGELTAWLEHSRSDVAVIIDHACRPIRVDALSELISLAAANGIAVAGGAVTRQPVLSDGFRATSNRSRYLFPHSVDPQCFAFRRTEGGVSEMLGRHDSISCAVAAMCAEAKSRGSVVVVSREAEFVCDDDARTGSYSIEERLIVEWTRRTASDRGEEVVLTLVDTDGAA